MSALVLPLGVHFISAYIGSFQLLRFLCVVHVLSRHRTLPVVGAMLANHCSKVFTCTDGSPASAGSIFRLVLGRCGKYVPCLFLR